MADDKKKICPLLSITGDTWSRCEEENCAWWHELPDWKKGETTGHCIVHELIPKSFNV